MVDAVRRRVAKMHDEWGRVMVATVNCHSYGRVQEVLYDAADATHGHVL